MKKKNEGGLDNLSKEALASLSSSSFLPSHHHNPPLILLLPSFLPSPSTTVLL